MTQTTSHARHRRGAGKPKVNPDLALDELRQLVDRDGYLVLTDDPITNKRHKKYTFRKLAWRYRHQHGPVLFLLLVGLTGAGLHGRVAARFPLILTGLCVLALYVVDRRDQARTGQGGRPARKFLDRRVEKVYAAACTLFIGLWLALAISKGPGGRMPLPGTAGIPLLALLATLGPLLARPYWKHHPPPAIVPLADVQPEEGPEPPAEHPAQRLWAQRVGKKTGRILPGSRLTAVTDISGGWRGTIQLIPGEQTYEDAIAKTMLITSAYDTDEHPTTLGSIIVEQVPTGRTTQAQITYFATNPLRIPPVWPGSAGFDLHAGTASIGLYPDMQEVPYLFWLEDIGPLHDLIAGTTGAGKSRLLDQLLAYERSAIDPVTGRRLITSIVLDPQHGQSLPEWIDQVAVYAKGVQQCLHALYAIRESMYARNKLMATIRWIDDQGRKRKGRESWHPTFGKLRDGEQEIPPLLSITIDEAHTICKIKEGVALLEEMALMARKCGIKLRLVTQVPLLEQLGGSSTLRDMVAAGNVIVLRTANPLTSNIAFNGTAPGDPSKLPKVFIDPHNPKAKPEKTAGLGFTLGGATRQSIMRTYRMGDAFGVANTGTTAPLAEVDRLAGGVYWTFNGVLADPDASKPLSLERSAQVARGGDGASATAPTTNPGAGPAKATPVERVPEYIQADLDRSQGDIPDLVVDGKKFPPAAAKMLYAMAALRPGTTFDRAEAQAAAGVTYRTVSTAAGLLRDAGLIAIPEPGTYLLTDKGRAASPAAAADSS